jgi:hypothetical protein
MTFRLGFCNVTKKSFSNGSNRWPSILSAQLRGIRVEYRAKSRRKRFALNKAQQFFIAFNHQPTLFCEHSGKKHFDCCQSKNQ